MIKGLHRLMFEKYSLYKGIGEEKHIDSEAFTVGGHRWVVVVSPELSNSMDSRLGDVYLGLSISLVSAKADDGVCCFHRMTLLDQSGKGNHLTQSFPVSTVIMPHTYMGALYFIQQDHLVKSPYLKDDCLKIECTISVVSTHGSDEIITPSIASPRCNDVNVGGVDFLAMLDTGEGCDVVFNVRGEERFSAHKFILSARSPVFRSMFVSSDQRELVITSMEPRVFKSLLHFIYSDTLPEEERALVVDGYAFGPTVSSTFGAKLLAAADEYDVKRLKSICESHLWRTNSLGRFAEILSVADRCNAYALKHLCFKYAADNYADLVELDNFNYLRENCPLLLNEMDDYIARERKDLAEMKKQDSTSLHVIDCVSEQLLS
ncbi:BTB/POZ and math domain-containing protein 4 [Phtheirospermum japonicum]|uniref:BTB/POZ and math domain-containing protein 4 n=1 Tax=Phtheirospermum japonicum TaxID=374723 RepID=A0A830C2I2_9LAMI|nr:BTB/POZ and math domain-containing protein 4 [Phtheirospermum japonicum]